MSVETQLARPAARTRRAHHERFGQTFDLPVLRARRGGLAERAAGAFGDVQPTIVFVGAMLAGLAALAAVSIALGVLVTRALEPAWGIGTADERLNVWLAAHRTSSRTDASLIGSILAGGVVLPLVVGSIALACAAARKWRLAAFTVFALAVEAAAYRATTLAVHAHRPRVTRLENLPVNASYPSGHTAAAIAVYGGLALVIASKVTNRVARAFTWASALLVVVFVAMSRMYRGMHHPLDVAGGMVVGVGALVVVVFACRAAAAAGDVRNGLRTDAAHRRNRA
jgi:membrane-associated phospholipid phosphatase